MPASYLIEKQSHIPQLSLYLHAPLQATATTSIHCDPHRILIQLGNNELITIHIDKRVNIDTGNGNGTENGNSITQRENGCLIKIPLIKTPDECVDVLFPTSNELYPINYHHLYCRQCSSSSSSSSSSLLLHPPSRCFPLPSTHWSELVELWYCHTTGNEQLDRLSALRMSVKPGVILVGEQDIRVDVRDVDMDKIRIGNIHRQETLKKQRKHKEHQHEHRHEHTQEEKKQEETDTPTTSACLTYYYLYCSTCDQEIGRALHINSNTSAARDTQTTPTPTELHILKYTISNTQTGRMAAVHSESDSALIEIRGFAITPLFINHYTFETHLSSVLLSLCQARCQYRFIINHRDEQHTKQTETERHTDTERQTPTHIKLTLLNTDTLIRTDTDKGPELRRVLKVAYQEQITDAHNTRAAADASAEVVDVGGADYDALLSLLSIRSLLLPTDFRSFRGQQLSYLYRLDPKEQD